MKKFSVFLLFVFFLSFISFILWQYSFSALRSVAKDKVFVIKPGESSSQIAVGLKKEGLVRSSLLFKAYVLLTGGGGRLRAGDYQLSAKMDLPSIAFKIITGEIIKVRVVIPEGFGAREIDKTLDQKFAKFAPRKFEVEKLKIEDFESEFSFLPSLPSASLEGFLFPDTYDFSLNANSATVARKMLVNFGARLTPALRGEIKRQGKTIWQIITVASLIEKEVRGAKDKKIVSGILWKRLKSEMPLQVDSTLAYAAGRKIVKFSTKEINIDSPYNTYKRRGLPPGPIDNPGLESILAAIYPQKSAYWYYLSTPAGKTIFSKNLREHNIAKAKYLR